MSQRTVSQLLLEDHSISIGPGAKGECPFCHAQSFSIKKDGMLGKCFSPTCGRFLTAEHLDRPQWLSTVLTAVYHDFHAELLNLDPAQQNAHAYLLHERGIHPRVIADGMLGAVPWTYDVVPHFQPVLAEAQAALQTLQQKKRGRPTKELERAEKRLQDVQDAQTKLIDCLNHKAGWLAFFYTNAWHRPIALRLRQPYAKHFVSFKPGAAGLFGRELFTPYQNLSHRYLNDFLLVTEGEFNALALQSLAVRYEEATGQTLGYVHCCAVGSVNLVDIKTIQTVATRPVICYDNDASNAGFALVETLQKAIPIEAFTTPGTPSDLDSFISTFQPNVQAAWNAVADLIQHQRQTHKREYSGTGEEFFATTITSPKTPAFIPKLLAEALLDCQYYRYMAEQLWVYKDGVYCSWGETTARTDAQALLSKERREHYLEETLRFIEVATRLDGDLTPNAQYINLQNGRLDWATGDLEPHTPEVFSITQLPIAYDPAALCPTFDHYLSTTFDSDTWPLIEELLGWCLIPTQRFEKAVMLTGEGANGKSVFLDLISALLGEDNVSNVALQDLEENRFRAAELYGKLANVFADLDTRALQSSTMFKTLTTGDRVTAERKHQHPFSFRSYAKLLFSANKIPSSRDRSYAFYRRWLIIPFTRTFDGQGGNPTPDMTLREKLLNELPGVLNRAIQGLERLATNEAFTEPASVKEAKASYIRSNDHLRTFIEECVELNHNGHIEKKDFYLIYKHWCEHYSERELSQKTLLGALKQLIPTLGEGRATPLAPRAWLGISWTLDAKEYLQRS